MTEFSTTARNLVLPVVLVTALATAALVARPVAAQEPAPAPAPTPADPAAASTPAAPTAASAPATPTAEAPTATPQVRMRWQDFIAGPEGEKRVASLKAAVAKMKELNQAPAGSVDFRRSWAYWANIHGYYGPESRFGTVEAKLDRLIQQDMKEYLKYYTGIVDQTPPDDVAKATWGTCEHSSRARQANFFGWHRMYLYYFERVLRWAANDETLRLPYWDYTSVEQLAIPAPYLEMRSAFYDPRRDPGMNDGAGIDANLTDVDDLLGNDDYLAYELAIERGVHGNVHCTVGPTCPVAHMGDVPVAAGDPVFYSHHANIDRLWACWQNLYPTPAGDWQSQQFSFPDADGQLVTRPVSDFLDSAKLGYVYDNVKDCKRPAGGATPVAAPGAADEEPQKIARVDKVKVDKPKVAMSLGLAKARLKTTLAAMKPAEKLMLVLEDVAAASQPGVIFKVFLTKKGSDQRLAVGSINFFGAFHLHEGHGAPGAAELAEPQTLEFDVTDEVAKLGEADLQVEIEATTGRAAADPAAAKAELDKAAKAFRSAAKVTIGAIELRVDD